MRQLLFVTALLCGAPWPGAAQDHIGPADAIRVVERIETGTRRATRFVVEDLSPGEILRLQVELARAGYDPRSRSGMLDERTRRELSRLQTARGLEVCGCVTYETVVALGIQPYVVAWVEGGPEPGYAPAYSDRTYVRDESFVIYAPGRHYRDRVYTGPGVVVGHEPAVGSGHRHRDRDRDGDRYRGRATWRDTRPLPPQPPRTGSRIRRGDPPGGPDGGTRNAPPRP